MSVDEYKGEEKRKVIYVSDPTVERGIKIETIILAALLGIGSLSLWFVKDMATNIQTLTERTVSTKTKVDGHVSDRRAHRK